MQESVEAADLTLVVSFRVDLCRTMASSSFILLGIFVLTCSSEINGQLTRMSVQGSDDILGKLQPQIGQISKLMAASVEHGTKDTEQLIADHITKDLGLVLEKLETTVNRTQDGSDAICCRCNRCQKYFQACGRTCCQTGDQWCICNSCSSDKMQNVPEVGHEQAAPINSWLESARSQLQINLANLMQDINGGKTKCCTCVICKKKFTGCFNPFCCAKGGKICKCITCSSATGKLIASMDSVDDSSTSFEAAQPAQEPINSLIDNLLVLINSP